jgi:acetyltransferase-like isoleucine patch superfamily enzyme
MWVAAGARGVVFCTYWPHGTKAKSKTTDREIAMTKRLLTDGVLVSDGVLVGDGVLVSDGVLISD